MIETDVLIPSKEGGADALKEKVVVPVQLKVGARLADLQLESVRETEAVRQEEGQCVGEELKLLVMEVVPEREKMSLVLCVPDGLLEKVCVTVALRETLADPQTLALTEGLAEGHRVAELHCEGVAVPETSLLSVPVAHRVGMGVALRV